MAPFSNTAEVRDQDLPWQFRITRASMPNEVGLIVRAMLALKTQNGYAFGRTCDVTLDGSVWTMIRRPGKKPVSERIGSLQTVVDNMRRLCDHCKLSDADREAVFAELRRWVRRDERAKSE